MIDDLCDAIGNAHVLINGDLSTYEQDWRRRHTGKALAVVLPANTTEVVKVVKICAAAGVAIVPQGGNTSLSVGSTPDASGSEVVLNLSRMNAIRSLDQDNTTITVEAGCILHNVQQAAAEVGLLFPLSLASEGSCTIGGNLGSNAGGTQVLRYGNSRELCLGLEVVTAQGDIWNGLRGLRKDNTGYDLRDVFIGSEGTLGIITAATLKLFPQPAAQLTAWAVVPSMAQAVALLGLAQQYLGAGLTGFEVMGQFALHLVHHHLPQLRVPFIEESQNGAAYAVLLENSDTESQSHARARLEALLQAALQTGCITDAIVAENLAQARQLWQVRENIPLAQAAEGLNIKHDISLPISQIPAFVEHTSALLQQKIAGVHIVNFGHLGDGNLHFNIQAPAGSDGKAFLQAQEERVNDWVYGAVAQFGGSFSAEHGIGALKVATMQKYQSPVALQIMRAIKQALDPHNVFNPGRVLPR